jgi:hypothetical protein
LMPGMLSEGSRVVLLLGGSTIFLSGIATLWRLRVILIAMGHIDRRSSLEAVTQAFRNYRRSVTGQHPTEEMIVVPNPDLEEPTE